MAALGERLTTNEALQEIARQVKGIVRRRRRQRGGDHTFARRPEICPVIESFAKLRNYLHKHRPTHLNHNVGDKNPAVSAN